MKANFRLAAAYSAILGSGEFDGPWYLGKYDEAADAVLEGRYADALEHYVVEGRHQRYNPNFLFDEKAFAHAQQDALAEAKDRFLSGFHLALAKPEIKEDFLADRFSFQWYRERHATELRERRQSPIAHYLSHRRRRDVMPTALFSDAWYLTEHADALGAVYLGLASCGYEHFLSVGIAEQRSPSPLFSERWYRETYPDVNDRIDGFLLLGGYCHFLKHGDAEQRHPSPYFDPQWYARSYPDLSGPAARSEITFYRHYLSNGFFEGRMPSLLAKETLELRSPKQIGLFDPIDTAKFKELVEAIAVEERAIDFLQRCCNYLHRSNADLDAMEREYTARLESLAQMATYIRSNLA